MNDNTRNGRAMPRWLMHSARALPVLALAIGAQADHTSDPSSVSILGDLNPAMGCPGEWQPDCTDAALESGADDIWRGSFTLPAGDYEYKAAINGGWDENYGANATADGGNIALSLSAEEDVRFYYSHSSHWVADSVNDVIATAVGDFQSELGYPGDWQPECMISWVQDIDNTGIYQYTTTDIPPPETTKQKSP